MERRWYEDVRRRDIAREERGERRGEIKATDQHKTRGEGEAENRGRGGEVTITILLTGLYYRKRGE